jgi:hypothetical protein
LAGSRILTGSLAVIVTECLTRTGDAAYNADRGSVAGGLGIAVRAHVTVGITAHVAYRRSHAGCLSAAVLVFLARNLTENPLENVTAAQTTSEKT